MRFHIPRENIGSGGKWMKKWKPFFNFPVRCGLLRHKPHRSTHPRFTQTPQKTEVKTAARIYKSVYLSFLPR